MMLACRRVAFVLLFASTVAVGADDKFEVVSEKTIPDLATGASALTFKGISPDGKSILRIGYGRLTMGPVGATVEKELLPQGSLTGPLGAWATWSADAKSIYYLTGRDKPEFNDLWQLDIASLKKHCAIKNVRGAGAAAKPSPSPDGKRVAFYRGPVLMLADADDQNERVLCERCTPAYRELVWSPDSSQLVLVPEFQESGTKLRLLNVASGQAKTLTAFDAKSVISIIWPSWSSGPLLTEIVLQGNRIQGSQVWQLRVPQNGEKDDRVPVTRDPDAIYIRILGVGAEGYSLVIQKFPPQPTGWDEFVHFFERFGWNPPAPQVYPIGQKSTVLLTLKK
jgi:hypothetical protein